MLLPAQRLVFIVVAAIAGSCAQAPASAPSPSPAVAPPGAETATTEFNTLGAADAPITIIEFTDLQCPYCARFALQTLPRLKQAYIDTGKVRYASRDLPLSIHPHAGTAAVAARCAGEQGRFWQYRRAVFAAQDRLATKPWDEIAGTLGLDVGRFAACRRDGRQRREVQADAQLAAGYGLSSTPSFVIGRLVNGEFMGEIFTGAKSFDAFATKIDALLVQ